MPKDHSRPLNGCRILVLEDEYFLANDLEAALAAHGAQVIGPAAKLSEARSLVARDGFDVAVMDVSLRDESAYPMSWFATTYRSSSQQVTARKQSQIAFTT